MVILLGRSESLSQKIETIDNEKAEQTMALTTASKDRIVRESKKAFLKKNPKKTLLITFTGYVLKKKDNSTAKEKIYRKPPSKR